jgi:hypothetical protein
MMRYELTILAAGLSGGMALSPGCTATSDAPDARGDVSAHEVAEPRESADQGGLKGESGIALTVLADREASRAVVSLGVPFAAGARVEAARLTVVDEHGNEVPSYARTLATWPEDGSPRSILVAFRATMRAGESRAYRIREGAPCHASSGPLAPNPDGPFAAILDPRWYAASHVIGYQVAAADDTAFPAWETGLEAALASMDPPWQSYGTSCDATSGARTYYDGPHALFQRFIHRGTSEAYRRARAEATWYRDHELVWFDHGNVAVHACVPTWDPTVPLDGGSDRWVPIRRLTGQGMLDDYLLTGDPGALAAVRGIGEAFLQDLDALTTIAPVTVKATERNMGWTMLGLASDYAVTPTPALRAALDRLVAMTAAWQAEGTSGAFEHDLHYADATECRVGPRGGSPFMTAILVEGLMETWFLTHHPAIPAVVVKAATWYRDCALTTDGKAFRYLWGCEDRAYDDSSMADLNLLIAPVFGAAYFHARDPRWLDFGDAMVGHGIARMWARKPKQWSQSARALLHYMGSRALDRRP